MIVNHNNRLWKFFSLILFFIIVFSSYLSAQTIWEQNFTQAWDNGSGRLNAYDSMTALNIRNKYGHNAIEICPQADFDSSGYGHRVWIEEATDPGGELTRELPGGIREIYFRYYLRYQPGYKWTDALIGQKQIRIWIKTYENVAKTWIIFGPSGKRKALGGKIYFCEGDKNYVGYSMMANSGSHNEILGGDKLNNEFWLTDIPNWNDGVWVCYEYHLKMGTPGAGDGVMEAWVNGNQVMKYDSLIFLDSFATHSGIGWEEGDICGISWGSNTVSGTGVSYPNEQWMDFDAIKVSSQYIGTVPSAIVPDNIGPVVMNQVPERFAMDVSETSAVTFHLEDIGQGVDTSSIVMKVNESRVYPAIEKVNRVIAGAKDDYLLSYTPAGGFNYGETVKVEINAMDLNSNAMNTPMVYTFRIKDDPGIPIPDTSIKIDLGRPFEEQTPFGWKSYTAAAPYNATVGYGWSDRSGIITFNNGLGDYVYRDRHVIENSSTTNVNVLKDFLIDLKETGNYKVTLHFGATSAYSETSGTANIYAEGIGEPKLSGLTITTGTNYFYSKTFEVYVDDGQLKLTFEVGKGGFSVCGIEVEKIVETATVPPVNDTTPPQISSTIPANNVSGVAINSTIKATFSEDVQGVTSTTFKVNDGTSDINGTVNYSNKTATFTPSANLLNNTQYTVTITTGVNDPAGNALSANYIWKFTTESFVLPGESVKLIDFDKSPTSVTMSGWSSYTGAVAYNATVGYGWDVVGYPLEPRDRGGVDSIYRDFHMVAAATSVLAGTKTFKIDVPSGTYNVKLYFGDLDYASNGTFNVYAEDILQISGLSILRGTQNYATKSFNVDIKDGQLNLKFEPGAVGSGWIINGIEVPKIATGDTENPAAVILPVTSPVNVFDTVTFNGSYSSDNIGVTGYAWDFGDNATSTNQMATHSYTTAGTYIAKLIVKDAAGNSSLPAQVNIIVNAIIPTNKPPAADPQAVIVMQDSSLKIFLSGSDPENGALTYEIVAGPAKGKLSAITNINEIVYTPDAGYYGPDLFQFKVKDNGGLYSAEALVGIIVQAKPTGPVIFTADFENDDNFQAWDSVGVILPEKIHITTDPVNVYSGNKLILVASNVSSGGANTGVKGDGVIMVLNFKITQQAITQSKITFTNNDLINPSGKDIPNIIWNEGSLVSVVK